MPFSNLRFAFQDIFKRREVFRSAIILLIAAVLLIQLMRYLREEALKRSTEKQPLPLLQQPDTKATKEEILESLPAPKDSGSPRTSQEMKQLLDTLSPPGTQKQQSILEQEKLLDALTPPSP